MIYRYKAKAPLYMSMLCGLAGIFDGLVRLLSLGTLCSSAQMFALRKALDMEFRIKTKE